jgi:uncharacterized phage protein (TIGR01671 family)
MKIEHRTIKFRAWDKKRKEWIPQFQVYQNGSVADDGDWITSKDLVLTQFTGLKDKNGKEIFEGDILQWMSALDIPQRMSVEWNTEYGWWWLKSKTPAMNSLGTTMANSRSLFEVIGNMYESPELLK